MDLRWAVVSGLLLATMFAGCGSKGEAPTSTGEDLSGTHGTVLGLITDDEARPVDGAEVALKTLKVSPIALKIFTNSEGRFRLEAVPAGRQTVCVNKEGFEEGCSTVTVVPGAETQVRMVLKPKAVVRVFQEPLAVINGQVTCGWENVLYSTECEYEVKNQTHQDPTGGQTTTNNHTWDIPPNWGGLLIEVTWTYGVASSQGIRFQLESQEDIGGAFVKTTGSGNRLRIAINAFQVYPDSTLGYPIPQRGVATWIHVLPSGEFAGATCQVQCGYGVQAGVNLQYQVYRTIFYGQGVPADFSQIPE